LAQEAHGHYYGGDTLEAIDVARYGYAVAKAPCTGAALAAALEARAQATLGRDKETRDALRRAEYVLSRLDGDALIPSAFGYNEASFRFHEGNAYTHLGDIQAALKAQERALELCPQDNYTDWAMTRLDRAQCLTYTGEVAEAVKYVGETITNLTAWQRRGILTLRAKQIVGALPEGARLLPAVRDLYEILMLADGREGDHYR